MTSLLEKSKSNEHSSLLPMDMSWDSMDKMFRSMKNHWPFHLSDDTPFRLSEMMLNPNVDIKEDKKSYEISAELPGLDKDDIHVDLTNQVLTISGEKKTESTEDKDENYHVMERRYGYFKRSFTLPNSIEQEKIKADFKKGILHITLPKSESAIETPRKIKVND